MSEERLRDERLSALYRDSTRDEPPAALDRIILDAARAGVARRPAPAAPWWKRWTAPVAAFATVVLTVTLTLMVRHEQEQIEKAPPAPMQEKAASIPAAAPPPAAVSESGRTEAAAPAPAAKAPEAAAPAKKLKQAEPAPEPRPFASEAKESAPAPAAQPLRRETAAGAVAAPAAPAPPADAETEPRAAPAAKPAAESLRFQSAPAAADSVENRAGAAPLRKQESRISGELRSPEAWIGEIRQLRKQGRDKEAQDALEAFRRAYPDYSLPEDLR